MCLAEADICRPSPSPPNDQVQNDNQQRYLLATTAAENGPLSTFLRSRKQPLSFTNGWAHPRRGLCPKGRPVWIYGDCHLGNLGPVADAKGRVKIAIRDIDQTVIGNPAHDLIRLGLSLATAIRGSDLPGVTTALMLEKMMEGYEAALAIRGKTHENLRRLRLCSAC